MSAPTPLRQDFDASQLRGLARKTKDGPQARRLLALAAIYDGATRTEAAKIGGVGLQIIRESIWRNGSSRNSASQSPSRRSAGSCEPWATANYRPDRVTMRKPRARSRILKNFPARLEAIARKKALDRDTIEIWFADEARIGQKNKITRRWAKRGTRPSAPRDQRTASTYIFGAVCPKEGKGAALIMPACNTEAMNLHLAEIAATVAPAAHAILLVDQAGWHLSTRLLVPANITIILLPPKCPELNPVENVWQFMRDNWLSNRIFKSYDDLVDHCCAAWNKLVDQPWRIMSIGLRQWATGSDQWDLVLSVSNNTSAHRRRGLSGHFSGLPAQRLCDGRCSFTKSARGAMQRIAVLKRLTLSCRRASRNRQRRCRLDLLHGEARGDVLERHRRDQALVECIVAGDVGHDHAQHIVDITGHSVKFHHLGHGSHFGSEPVEPLLGVVAGLDRDEDGNAEPDLVLIDQCDSPLNHSVGFQPLDTLPTGCGGQAHQTADLGDRMGGILLQKRENLAVDGVHRGKPYERNRCNLDGGDRMISSLPGVFEVYLEDYSPATEIRPQGARLPARGGAAL